MDEKDIQTALDVEDIIKEVAAMEQADEAMEQALEQMPIAQEPPLEERLKAFQRWADEDGDVKRFVPQTDRADPAMEGQTVRVNPEDIRAAMEKKAVSQDRTIPFAPVTQDGLPVTDEATIRFEPVVCTDDTIRFVPLGEEESVICEPLSQQLPPQAEPFSAGWEPQYDEPIGEYVPPEPIAFVPRSRLGELKTKLEEGPERRFRQLVDQGLGRLQAAIFLSALVVVLSFVAIGMHSLGMVRADRMQLLVGGEVFAILLSALLGFSHIRRGFAGLIRGRFNPNTMLALSLVICLADGFYCLRENRVPFCAAFCLAVTMALWGDHQKRSVEMSQMDTLRRANRLSRVAKAPGCYENLPGFYVTDGEVEDFMDHYHEAGTPTKVLNLYCLFAFGAATAIALIAGFAKGASVGLQTWSAAMLTAMPVTVHICQSRPAAVLERRLHRFGVVLCGWKGVKAACGSGAVPLYDRDLFPLGSVKIHGVKFYTNRDSDQTVAYAAAVMECTGNALTPLFTGLLESRSGRHYDVANYHSYDKAGVGGEVCGEGVLLGSAQFLQDMGVDIPQGTRVNQAVYMAVDGELCGVFALAFGKLRGVSAGLAALCGDKGLTTVLVGDNFLLNEGFLRGKFSVNTRRVAFPPAEQRLEVEGWTPDPEKSVPCALTTQEGLAGVAFAITGARALRSSCGMGALLHIGAGIVGMLLVLVLTLIGADTLLTPGNLVMYHLAWCLPGLIVSSWPRYLS